MKTPFNIWCIKQLRKNLISRNKLAHILGITEANVDSRMLQDNFSFCERFYIQAYFASLLTGVPIPIHVPTIDGKEVTFSVYFKSCLRVKNSQIQHFANELHISKPSLSMRIYKECFSNSEKYYIKYYFTKKNIRIK